MRLIGTPQKMKLSINKFFIKFEQTGSFQRICFYLLKEFLIENFIFLCSERSAIFIFRTTGNNNLTNIYF